MRYVKPFFFCSFWNAGKNAQSSSSTTSAEPASKTEGIYTISHIPFRAMCRDSMSTQVWYNVLSHSRCRWRNLFLLFSFFWNAGKNDHSSSSTTSAEPASQTEGICTILHFPFGAICRDCMSTHVWYNVLSHYRCRWRNLFLLFFPFEMQVKTPIRPRLRHQLSQLHKRKVFAPFYTFLLEPYVGTVCQHTFGIMF